MGRARPGQPYHGAAPFAAPSLDLRVTRGGEIAEKDRGLRSGGAPGRAASRNAEHRHRWFRGAVTPRVYVYDVANFTDTLPPR